jgi:pimeloyl-ACP methyl ester carboxylesterase
VRKFASSLCFALVPAVVAVVAVVGGGTQNPPPTTGGDPNPVVFAPGRLVPIGGGRRLYLKCEGHGTPTVILEAGRGGTADGWIEVQDAVARITRTCAYDRAGLGNSLPGPGHGETDQIADLQRLLRHAKLPAPYVLVGAGYGGSLVRRYADVHPSETRGLVLIGAPVHPRREHVPMLAVSSGQPSIVTAAVRRACGPAELAARTRR